jgi:hypothetical protein
MKRKITVVLLLALFLPLAACNNNPYTARQKLHKLGIPFEKKLFCYCIEQSDVVAVKLFLDAGMNPNVKYAGFPALMFATDDDSVETLKTLLSKGADPNVAADPVAANPNVAYSSVVAHK